MHLIVTLHVGTSSPEQFVGSGTDFYRSAGSVLEGQVLGLVGHTTGYFYVVGFGIKRVVSRRLRTMTLFWPQTRGARRCHRIEPFSELPIEESPWYAGHFPLTVAGDSRIKSAIPNLASFTCDAAHPSGAEDIIISSAIFSYAFSRASV
jgi:hypothetical protein